MTRVVDGTHLELLLQMTQEDKTAVFKQLLLPDQNTKTKAREVNEACLIDIMSKTLNVIEKLKRIVA